MTNDRREIDMTETKRDEFIEEVYGNLDFLTEEEVAVIAAEAFDAGREWCEAQLLAAYVEGVLDTAALVGPFEDEMLAAATEAFEKGDDAGFIAGITAGFEDGFAAGSSAGYDDGYADSQRELHNGVGV
jgi:flagellar biosynthesis/type III secretory pathway protein FliH